MTGPRAWLPRTEEGGPTDLTALKDVLPSLRARVGATDDPALRSLLGAVDEMARKWQDERAAVEAASTSHARARGREERTRRGLTSLLQTLADLAELVPQSLSGAAQLPGFGERPDAGEGQMVEVPRPGAPSPSDLASAPVLRPGPIAASTAGPTAELTARLLGPFQLFVRGRLVDGWHGTKTPRVLRYLIAHHERPVSRDVLLDEFWPDANAEAGRRNLHQCIYMIRKALRDEDDPAGGDRSHIVFDNDAYVVNPAIGLWSDADAFERHALEGKRAAGEGAHDRAATELARAVALYRGDFLEDLPYDEWALQQRRYLRMLFVETANRLADARLSAGLADEALGLSQRVLSFDPCDEVAHRRALRCYAAQGNLALVREQFEACAQDLNRLLGVEPSPETVQLYAELRTGSAPTEQLAP